MKKANLAALIFFLLSKVYIIYMLLAFLALYLDFMLLGMIALFMLFLYPGFSLLTNVTSLVIQLFNISKNKKKRYIIMLVSTIVSILFAVFGGWVISGLSRL